MTLDWQKLYAQGRVKDIGIAFSNEELHAVYELKIPVQYVRDGILTQKAYEAARAADLKNGVPLSRMSRGELFNAIAELGADNIPSGDAPDTVLRDFITRNGGLKKLGSRKGAAEKSAPKKVGGAKKQAAKKAPTAPVAKTTKKGNDSK